MPSRRQLAEWMTERGIDAAELAVLASLDKRVVEAIAIAVTPPVPISASLFRSRLASIPSRSCGAARPAVDHIYGHGPQFGRSP